MTEENNTINNNGNVKAIAANNKPAVRYKECLKNHAAAIGGNAIDGCGEFMPGGEEGTMEALKCSACNCHRNFHRQETGSDHCPSDCYHPLFLNNNVRKLILGTPHPSHKNPFLPSSPPPQTTVISSRHGHQQVVMAFKGGSIPSETDEKDIDVIGRANGKVRKRFRTKFTEEQKEKMFKFAEKGEWRIQKMEESEVQKFCEEIGIKRRVLKVWMHNNKQSSLAKKHIPAG